MTNIVVAGDVYRGSMSPLATILEPRSIERASPRRGVACTASAQSAQEDRLAFADVLRLVAILGVVFNHLALVSGIHPFDPRDDFGCIGAWGVNCFFVLSGFLLSRPYLESILGRRPFPSTQLFLTRRFFRIYPLYAFAVVVSGFEVAMHAPHDVPIASMLSHLTFLHGFSTVEVLSLNSPFWTMAVDAQFYILLPLGAFVLGAVARTSGRVSGTTIIAGAIAATIALSLAVRWYVFSHLSASIVGDSIGPAFVLARNAVGMGTAFALGILLALLQLFGKRPGRLPASVIGAAGIACLLFLIWCARVYGTTPEYAIGYDALAAVSAALILLGFGEGAFNVAGIVRRSRRVTELAALAYAVYLFHWLIIDMVNHTVEKQAHWASGSLEYFAGITVPTLIATAIVATVAHRFVEKPFLTLRDRNREAAPEVAASTSRSRDAVKRLPSRTSVL
ncbi:MAG: acyltransferase [Candidatus Eremiobacteraeota bacterium]|nr:acyltransferase [Candidatus Eremiobacteraeota bacterium]